MDANSAASSAGFSDAALATSPHDIASEMTTTKRNLIEIMALTNPCALNSDERLNQGLIQRKDQLSEYARAATATTTRTSSGNACPCRITELAAKIRCLSGFDTCVAKTSYIRKTNDLAQN